MYVLAILTINNTEFCTYGFRVYTFISLKNINYLILLMVKCVLFALRAESINMF